MKKILVTGGAGYIGSHTVVELADSGYDVVVTDNFKNSKPSVITRLGKITGKKLPFENIDLCNKQAVTKLFDTYDIDSVIHFASLKAVGESVANPLAYYRNNIDSTLTLLEVMQGHGIKSLIFSSSATVYGLPSELPLRESSKAGVGITNPYGQTKFMIEQILKDLHTSDKDWRVTLLRYFNPIGAHPSGLIGEDPDGIPNNLLPFIQQVASGKLEKLKIFGNDYDTPDGTCVRDYVHVVDLAKGHVAALKKLGGQKEAAVYNLGIGKGMSVLEVVNAFEAACSVRIPYDFADRRPGDIEIMYADVSKALTELNWKARLSIEDACRDAWRWQQYALDELDT